MVTNQQYQKVLEYMAPLLLQNDSLVTLSMMKKGNHSHRGTNKLTDHHSYSIIVKYLVKHIEITKVVLDNENNIQTYSRNIFRRKLVGCVRNEETRLLQCQGQ